MPRLETYPSPVASAQVCLGRGVGANPVLEHLNRMDAELSDAPAFLAAPTVPLPKFEELLTPKFGQRRNLLPLVWKQACFVAALMHVAVLFSLSRLVKPEATGSTADPFVWASVISTTYFASSASRDIASIFYVSSSQRPVM